MQKFPLQICLWVPKYEACSSSWFIPSSAKREYAKFKDSATKPDPAEDPFRELVRFKGPSFQYLHVKAQQSLFGNVSSDNLACLRATYLLVLRPGIPVPGRDTILQSGSTLEQTSLESKDGGFLSNWTCPFRSFAHDGIAMYFEYLLDGILVILCSKRSLLTHEWEALLGFNCL